MPSFLDALSKLHNLSPGSIAHVSIAMTATIAKVPPVTTPSLGLFEPQPLPRSLAELLQTTAKSA